MLKFIDIHKLETWKFLYSQLNDPNPILNLTLNNNVHNYNTRNREAIHVVNQGRNLTTISRNFITHNGCISYNALPPYLKNSPNLNIFKSRTKKFLLSAY